MINEAGINRLQGALNLVNVFAATPKNDRIRKAKVTADQLRVLLADEQRMVDNPFFIWLTGVLAALDAISA